MTSHKEQPAVDTSAEKLAGASLVYAEGVEAFAARTKTDDAGWTNGLALRLNPELPAYVGRHVRDYALGVLSDINLDDLNHWALGDFRLTEPDEMAAERRLGVRIGWRPHPATLRKMLAPGLRALESQEQAGG